MKLINTTKIRNLLVRTFVFLLVNTQYALAQSPLGPAEELDIPTTEASPDNLKRVINILVYVAGALSVVFIIVGGIMFITSAGNPEQTKRARNTLLYAVVGLLISIVAFALVNFILVALG